MFEEKLVEKLIDWFNDDTILTREEFNNLYVESENEEIDMLDETLKLLDEETDIENVEEYKE